LPCTEIKRRSDFSHPTGVEASARIALHRLYSHIEQHAAELEERTRKAEEDFRAGWDA
jgi:hypothetical protein